MAEFHLTDEQFFDILRENAGIFSRTAKAITERYGINYSRQAAQERASKQPELLQDIKDDALDTAEAGMNDLMVSTDEDVKFKSCQFVLKTLGKKRGYVERTEVEHSGNMSITWEEIKTYETKDINVNPQIRGDELPPKIITGKSETGL